MVWCELICYQSVNKIIYDWENSNTSNSFTQFCMEEFETELNCFKGQKKQK